MKFQVRRRYAVGISLALAAVVATSGAVFAYWTVGGTGGGTAAAGTVADVSVVQDTTLVAMYPGDSAQTISGHFVNTNVGPVYVGQLKAEITGVDETAAALAANPGYTCSADDFAFTVDTITVGAEIPTGNTNWSGIRVHFNDLPTTNQDACKGATVHITYTVVP